MQTSWSDSDQGADAVKGVPTFHPSQAALGAITERNVSTVAEASASEGKRKRDDY